MNISYKWLKEYVDFDLTPQEVAEFLTSTGLEAEASGEVESIKGGLKGLYVGEVLTCENHPDSDHLHITTVNIGKESVSQIVCGATNVAAGQKVIVADIGCKLYNGDQEFTIKKTKLRGVESYGMICAEDEIGVGTSHEGIIVLPDTAVVGTPAAKYYNVESDYIIEIDITANRSDALSHYGVARDLYACLKQNGYKTALHKPNCDTFKVDNNSLPIKVTIENQEACKRYSCLSMKGVEVKESPSWLKNKLTTIGINPINNVVDVTNYVMFAYGQPMHCFDADMVEGQEIIVKSNNEGKKFVTLDGEEHTLGKHDLTICNVKEPMCIAGVFGGKGSGTYETTTNIVLESAYFNPTWIRKSAKTHGLSTDASFRFERGTDPNNTIYALKQAAMLIKELAGGEISMDILDVYPMEMKPQEVNLSYEYLNCLTGKNLEVNTIKDIVESLEMKILNENNEGLTLSIPTYRTDVERSCDVAEDILRIYGYNNIEIPTQLKSSLVVKGIEDKAHKITDKISNTLVGSGFNEIMCNSLTKEAYYNTEKYKVENCVRMMNPLSSDLSVMRQTLLFGGLESIARNVNRKHPDLKLFELGNVYAHYNEQKNEDNPLKAYREEQKLGIWITGKSIKGSWIHANQDSSFYELQAHVNNILSQIGINKKTITTKCSENDIYSQSIVIETKDGRKLCEAGIVSNNVLNKFKINQTVYFAELEWTTLTKTIKKKTTLFKSISKFPEVSRDLALLINKEVNFKEIEEIAYQTEKKLLKKVELFDVYEGDKLPENKKSYAVNFILQDEEKTLNDKQIDAVMNKLIQNLKTKLNAELR